MGRGALQEDTEVPSTTAIITLDGQRSEVSSPSRINENGFPQFVQLSRLVARASGQYVPSQRKKIASTKMAYLINFGLAPFFREYLQDVLAKPGQRLAKPGQRLGQVSLSFVLMDR
ncbi:hypothetical protein DAPPUDRAFT_333207 [Daphnia pulex]|uniref:Uncharacterized protein n=1 Tax=Daphnia pulex TaxID=6669 RepID=E9HS74_DAPPU|nr:hypothetical protein DAPPUDRAFT_333207 [Daphnia pulex]|eukprot:EFX65412.1 hypothetical protein DAPPUDRAFT_333207 [Daphnia pulex]